jgi:endonuclease YncB( thermonuclease family)
MLLMCFVFVLSPLLIEAQTVVTVGGGASVTCPATPTATWTTPPSGLTFSNWSRGSGVTCGTAANALNGGGFNTASAAASFTANKFYSMTITANSSTSFTLNGVSWITQLSGSTNSCNFTVQYVNNGGTLTTLGTAGQSITSSGAQTTFNFTGSVSVAAGTSIVLYLIPHQATAAGTNVRWVNGSTITVTTASPVITGATTTAAFTTTYGAASATQSFAVSGANLTANLVATAPVGFEVSSDNITFGSTATFAPTGGNASGTLRIRLRATAVVSGNYNSQTIVLSSTGATAQNITTPATGNAVSPASLTITANNQAVAFGTPVATVIAAGSYTPSGFVNGETASVISGTATYTTTYTDTTPAGTSGVTITPNAGGLTAANYTFTPADGTITITSSPVPSITSALTASATYGTSFTYQITADNAPTSFNAVNLPTGLTINTVTGEISGIPTAAPGAYSVGLVATNAGGDGTATLSLSIAAKGLTIDGIAAVDREYNGLTSVAYTGGTLNGVFGSDTVSFTGTASVVTKTAEANKPVTFALTLNGAQAGNYTLTQPTGITVSIATKTLTVNGATAQNKVFDGNANAVISGTLNGVVLGDTVTFNGTGTFASSAIGNNIAVTSTSTLGGVDAPNYTLTQPTGLTANITPAIVPLVQWNTFGNTGNETTEDSVANNVNLQSSTLNFTGSTVTPNGNGNRFGGTWGTQSVLTTNQYIQFTVTPNVGFTFTPTSFVFIWDRSSTGPSSVALRSSVDGFTSDLGVLNGLTSGGASTTTTRTITILGLSTISTPTTFRIYGYNSTGGTGGFDCASSVNNVVLNGFTEVAPAPSITTAGTPAALTTEYGTASSETSFTVSATFLQSAITVTAPTGFEVSATSGSGFGATATIGAIGNITNVPVYVRLAANAYVAGSPYNGNIVLTSTNATPVNVATASSTVTAKNLTITGIAIANKLFDGNTDATITGTPSLVGVVAGDEANVILGGTPNALFTTSAVGTDIPVTVSGYTLSGSASSNYSLTQPTGLVADITSEPTPVITSALTANGTYGTAFSYTITASNTPTSFNALNLPAGLTVDTLSGVISGTITAAPGNYTITLEAFNGGGSGTASLVLTVAPKTLTLNGLSVNDKEYDGNVATTTTGGLLDGIFSTDVVSFSATATFATKVVGVAKPVTVVLTLNGADASKYLVTPLTGLTASITAKNLTITGAIAQNKPFDGNTAATITGTLTGVVSGDTVTLVGTGVFASAVQGTGIPVTSTATLAGTDAGNYTLTQPTGLTANITQPAILMWNTFGNLGTESTEPSSYNNPNVAAASMSINGITLPTNPNRLGGSNWALATRDTNKYYEFTVTPNSGYQFTPSSFNFIWDRSGTGPNTLSIRSSIDNYASDIVVITGVAGNLSNFNSINVSSLANIQSTTTFRVYAYGATGTAGTGGFDSSANINNVILFGSTSLITGPTASVINGSTSVCDGDSAVIAINIIDGRSPFTVVYTDGTTNFTETNYVSGTNIVVSPTATTTYTLVSVTDANALAGTGNSGAATIAILPNQPYYLDADNDGFGAGAVVFNSCFPIAGYSTFNTDCNDANASIRPGAVDVCYDGIDNDCNGNIDNVGLPGGCTPIVSAIPTATCGTEVAYGGIVYSSWVTGAQGYRFRVTEVNPADDSEIPGTQVIVDMVLRNLYLHNLSNYKYNAKYKVEVAVRFNNVWQPNYSAPCFLLTPIPVSTMIGCGTQITGINTQIFSTIVPRSQGYRYRVQRLDNALQPVGPVQEIISGIRNFTFAAITDFRYDANYNVSCAVRNTDGTFLAYGPSCTIVSPKHPTTQVRGTQCNDYAVTSYSERIFADAVQFASQYRFRLFNEVQVYDFQVDRVLNNFRLSDFPGLVPGETYSVQVAVRMPNQLDFGPYSKTCTLVIPSLARTIEDTAVSAVAFDAQVYPNPFAEQFYFKVAAASQESFMIQVYDMMGRAIETRTVNADAIESTEVGANYPTGVYNVILTQGTNVKTLRVVKR